MKVGVEVITGFLGAGKSAFINSLINKTIATKERIVVITCENGNTQINEFTENGQSVKHINFMGESLKLNDCINCYCHIYTNIHIYVFTYDYK